MSSPPEKRIFLAGTGYCLPERVVTNQELETFIETTDRFIVERTGIRTRRFAAPEATLSDLATVAAERALLAAGLTIDQMDMLIVNTLTPDYHDPSQACYLQGLLQGRPIPAFDIRAQCSGGLYAMEIGRQFLLTGKCRRVLIICAEMLSKRLDPSNEGRNLAILLSDGAGAFVLAADETKGAGVVDILLSADGGKFDYLSTQSPGSRQPTYLNQEDVQAGRHHFRMRGKETFDHAVACLVQISLQILAQNHLSLADIAVVVPHQPNLRILEEVGRQLALPIDKMFITVSELGNMGSASFPVALALAVEQGKLPAGRLALFLTYGSGATWGAALYRC